MCSIAGSSELLTRLISGIKRLLTSAQKPWLNVNEKSIKKYLHIHDTLITCRHYVESELAEAGMLSLNSCDKDRNERLTVLINFSSVILVLYLGLCFGLYETEVVSLSF